MDYDYYFQNNQGMFVVQTQMEFEQFDQIKNSINFYEKMKSVPNYFKLREELYQGAN